jgi:hypothetical protein
MKPAKRRLWRKGDDVYEVTKGKVLLGLRVGIMRIGFLGNQMYYEVKVMRGTRIAILHSSFVKNVSNPIVSNVPSLVTIAFSPLAPDVPLHRLGAAPGHVSPPLPPPPSASVKNGVAQRTRGYGSGSGSGGSPTSREQPDFEKASPRIKHPPPIKPSSKPSNSLPSAVCVSSPGGPNNAANRTAAAVSDRKASLRSQNKTLNPFQVSSAARPAHNRAVVRQITKKSAKPARAGAKKTTELKTARAKKKKDCQRNSVNRARKCEHNRRATRCPDCVRSSGDGLRSLCPHWKQKGWCTQCKMDDSETVYYGEARR